MIVVNMEVRRAARVLSVMECPFISVTVTLLHKNSLLLNVLSKFSFIKSNDNLGGLWLTPVSNCKN